MRAEQRGKRVRRAGQKSATDYCASAAKQLRKCLKSGQRPPAEYIESLRELLAELESVEDGVAGAAVEPSGGE